MVDRRRPKTIPPVRVPAEVSSSRAPSPGVGVAVVASADSFDDTVAIATVSSTESVEATTEASPG